MPTITRGGQCKNFYFITQFNEAFGKWGLNFEF